MNDFEALLSDIRACTICEKYLPLGVNPIVAASATCKILIIGQAPGQIVHKTSIPWNDKSGDTLRQWLNIDKTIFYDSSIIAIVPMGFCYPGKGVSGDAPPRPECAPLWHKKIIDAMPNIQLTILIGQYAQKYYLAESIKPTLTETVQNYASYLPKFLPLPHPSPRNNIWLAKNAWFAHDVLPQLKKIMESVDLK